MAPKKVGVLGAGSWGTALAQHFATLGHEVTLWGRDQAVLQDIAQNSENSRYFPGVKLPTKIATSFNLLEAVSGKQLIIVAVPAAGVRAVAEEVCARIGGESLKAKAELFSETLILSGVKGLEFGSCKTAIDILQELWGAGDRFSVLGGPSFAAELVRGLPVAVTVAARSMAVARCVREMMHGGVVRVYTSDDVLGVEYGGIIKNVIAVAVGVADGLEMGQSARAALLTRGLREMRDMIVAMGGKERTVGGLSGLGDLILTAVGDLSRNRRVGLHLAKGEKASEIAKHLGQVAEGLASAQIVESLAREKGVEVPIIAQVARLLRGEISAREGIGALLAREPRDEG